MTIEQRKVRVWLVLMSCDGSKPTLLPPTFTADVNNLPKDVVVFGTRVKVKDLDLDEEETFVLVGPGKEDFSQNKILTNSPIGKGLVGKKKGETTEIQVPMGTLRFQVVDIAFE